MKSGWIPSITTATFLALTVSSAALAGSDAPHCSNAGIPINFLMIFEGGYREVVEKAGADDPVFSPPAQQQLGLYYLNGEFVERNYFKAAEWFRKAATKGMVQARYELAKLLLDGKGVAKDETAAAWRIQQAAACGYSEAQVAMGLAYSTGAGTMGIPVETDNGKAFEWFLKAANNGDTNGILGVATSYKEGRGVPQDFVRAHAWYNIAASKGGSPGSNWRDEMAQKMTPTQIAEAQRLARNWKPGYGRLGQNPNYKVTPAAPPRFSLGKPVELLKIASGSGFFVSADGHVLTNHHVVDEKRCFETRMPPNGKAELVAVDKRNDLALLKAPHPAPALARFRQGRGIALGAEVIAAGYPLPNVLTAGLNVTNGMVSALSGAGHDRALLQITAPVQQGNSGGPLLDDSGNVVGIIVAKLDAMKMARLTGDIPQNVNFAIKGAIARLLLEEQGVGYETAPSENSLKPEEIARMAKSFTVPIECWGFK